MRFARAALGAVLIAALLPGRGMAVEDARPTGAPEAKIVPIVGTLVSSVFGFVLDYARSRMNAPASAPASAVVAQTPAPAAEPAPSAPVTVGNPQQPASIQNGQPNYQGAKITVALYDGNGAKLGERPVSANFYTGERFRLKVLPTFTGNIEIDNINPKGERKRIYPQPGFAVQVQAGREIAIPAKDDQYFEFSNSKGVEQLVIAIRDPRATGAAQSSAQVYRQDDGDGSYYVQPVSDGSYPAIVQTIRFLHR